MHAERWERVQALFHAALELPEAERQAFVERECAGDPGLAADVLAMLEADAHGETILDSGLAGVAGDVLREPEPVPRTIGPYRLVRLLGEGGMGVVYLAEREDLGQRVAVKLLRDASLSPLRRERFTEEQRVLARLVHPSIAQLHDAAALPDGTPYFVMEYGEGVPITEWWAARRSSLRERLRLFRTLCEAVHFAHRHAIVHRDLKPSNVLVTEDGAVKLLDFGISKHLENVDSPVDQTQTALRLMTPAYAAPEQIRGDPVGTSADIYALGVILYELLCGRLPFDLARRTPGQIEATILEQAPERPSAVARKAAADAVHGRAAAADPGPTEAAAAEHTSGEHAAPRATRAEWADLDVVCLKAMHKDPQRRYRTAEALIRDVDRFLNGKPLEARPDSVRYRAGKFLRRNRRAVGAGAVVATLIVGLAVYHTVRLAQERNTARTEAAKARQVRDYLISLFAASNPFETNHADSLDLRALLERGVERIETLEGQPAVQAEMYAVLGQVHTRLSLYAEAQRLLERALDLRRRHGTPLERADVLAGLGVLHRYAGEYDAAEAALREALAIREPRLPPDHPDIATNLDELGVVLTNKGEYEEAEALYRRALAIRREIYEAPHVLLAASLNNLAVNLASRGDYAGGEVYLREAIEMNAVLFGREHASMAMELANLGVMLEAKEDYAAADSALSEALRIRRKTLGDEHSETAFNLAQLGAMLRRKGDYGRAEASLREALAIQERLLGADHRDVGVTLNHLGQTLGDMGDHAAAAPLLHRSYEIFAHSLGESHPFTAVTLCLTGYARHRAGQGGDTEPLFRECLSKLEAALPASHELVSTSKGLFGEVLAAEGRFDEAEPLLLDSHAQFLAGFGPDNGNPRRAARRLAELYEAWGRPEQAAEYRHAAGAGLH